MISVETIIGRLLGASSGDRETDIMIALVMGWKRDNQGVRGNPADDQANTLCHRADGKEEAQVPAYTSNLQDAYSLALQVAPRREAGFSWEADKASAWFTGEAPVQAATPMLALCAACMELKKRDFG